MPKFRSLAILGPTASGKSSLAIRLAKKINGEIIGLDSRQSYKFFEIGTAQPSKEQLKEICKLTQIDSMMVVQGGHAKN